MSLKERLKTFCDYLKIDVRAFEIKAGLSNGFVNNAGSNIRDASMKKIIDAYPMLNRVWLMTGEGNMIKLPRLEADVVSLAPDPYDQENREKIFELADGSLAMNVRVVPARAQ